MKQEKRNTSICIRERESIYIVCLVCVDSNRFYLRPNSLMIICIHAIGIVIMCVCG